MIYYYRAERASVDGGLSQEFLFRLAEIRRILVALSIVETASGREGSRSLEYLQRFGYSLDDEPKAYEALELLNRNKELAKACSLLFATERLPACDILEWLEMFLGVFQTADSSERCRHLAYFAQREWRVVQMFTDSIRILPLNQSELKDADPELCMLATKARISVGSISSKYGLAGDRNGDYLLTGVWDSGEQDLGGGRAIKKFVPFVDFIEEVILPEGARDLAERVLPDLRTKFSNFTYESQVVYVRTG